MAPVPVYAMSLGSAQDLCVVIERDGSVSFVRDYFPANPEEVVAEVVGDGTYVLLFGDPAAGTATFSIRTGVPVGELGVPLMAEILGGQRGPVVMSAGAGVINITSPVTYTMGTSKGLALRTGGAIPYAMRQVANRVSLPQSQNASFTQEKTETVHVLAASVNGSIEVWWPNWCVDGSTESAAGAAISTGATQITYTDRQTSSPVTVNMLDATGGTTAMSAPDGGNMVGIVGIDALTGTKIKPRERNVNSAGAVYSQFKSDLANGEKYEFGTSVPALGTAPVQTFANTWRGPALIRALSNKPVIAIIGDSIGDGIYDVPNTSKGDGGLGPRIISEAGGIYCNVSARGETAEGYRASMTTSRRSDIVRASGATAILAALGINSFNAGRTAAQVLADNQAIADYYGLPIIWQTIPAFTTGNIDTPWNAGKEIERQAYNAAVRLKSMYIDPDLVLCTSSGGWRNEDAVYIDYLHVANVGGAYAAANAPIIGTSLAAHGIAPRASGPVMPGKGTNLLAATAGRSINVAAWTKVAGTVAAGYKDAEYASTGQAFLETTGAAADHSFSHQAVSVSTGTYEFEMDVAYLGYQWLQFELAAINCFAGFDVLNGAAGAIFNSTPGSFAFTAIAVTALSNGFFRFKFTIVVNASATNCFPKIYTATGNLSGVTHVGDTAKGVIVRPDFYMRKTA